MAKLKDALIMQAEQAFEVNLGYEEWLYANQKLSESDICNMEEDLIKSSAVSSVILSEVPLNNPWYRASKGAR